MTELERLRNENDFLKEQVKLLREALVPHKGMALSLIFTMTTREADILAMLISKSFVTRESLLVGLYSALPDDWPDVKIIDVFISKLRTKLKRFHAADPEKYPLIEIKTVWGRGYYIEDEIRKLVNAKIDEVSTPAPFIPSFKVANNARLPADL